MGLKAGRDRDNKMVRAGFSRWEISAPSNCAKKANCKITRCACVFILGFKGLGSGWQLGQSQAKVGKQKGSWEGPEHSLIPGKGDRDFKTKHYSSVRRKLIVLWRVSYAK